MEMTHTFTLDAEHLMELKMLQAAMWKHAIEKGETEEETEKYYTLQKVFDFVMQLGQNNMIFEKIENAAYYYDKYYDEYPYEYGSARTKEMMKLEEETGKYVSNAYPNPTIKRR